ncbi:MAG: SseB family protein [Anaeromyxobacter sp.]
MQPDGSGLSPVAFGQPGAGLVAVFSSAGRAKRLARTAPYVMTINARELLRALVGEAGIALNPGYDQALELSAEGVGDVLRHFG